MKGGKNSDSIVMSENDGRFNLFYLNLHSELPSWYRSALEYFFDIGINVIDIEFDEFNSLLSKGRNIHVLVIAHNQKTRMMVEKKFENSSLGMAVRSKRINLFYISAISSKFSFSLSSKQDNFFFISMPIKISIMVKRVRDILESRFSADNKWPGGNRIGLLDLWEKK